MTAEIAEQENGKKRRPQSPAVKQWLSAAIGLTFAAPGAPHELRELIRGNSVTGKAADYDPFQQEA